MRLISGYSNLSIVVWIGIRSSKACEAWRSPWYLLNTRLYSISHGNGGIRSRKYNTMTRVVTNDQRPRAKIFWISDAGELYLTIKPRMVDLVYLISPVLSTLNDVTARRMINYYHVLRIKGEHFVIFKVRLHVAQVDSLPWKELIYLSPEMKSTATRAADIPPAPRNVPQPCFGQWNQLCVCLYYSIPFHYSVLLT